MYLSPEFLSVNGYESVKISLNFLECIETLKLLPVLFLFSTPSLFHQFESLPIKMSFPQETISADAFVHYIILSYSTQLSVTYSYIR